MNRSLTFLVMFLVAAAARSEQHSPNVVVVWNQLAYEIGSAEAQPLPFKGLHSMALMHLAMHDAINAVAPAYRPYAYRGRDQSGHAIAAAAQAAHDVLLAQYPDAKAKLDAELGKWTPSKSGVETGRRSAAAILAERADDGWDHAGTYEFRSQPGAYQTTPDWKGFMLQPGFRFAEPFGLARANQFRPAPPPSLASEDYAGAFNEVRTQGAIRSAERTPDQTAYALWWMEFAEGSINRLAGRLAIEQSLDLARAARMFALLNASLYDAYIATWDAKYEYNHWRPYTAIRNAAEDGNPGTGSDASWDSIQPAPPFPEYTSAHATGCSSSLAVLEETFGEALAFEMDTVTAPPGMKTRGFATFRAAAEECADSRVRLGWHFRYATDAGLTLGRSVANHIMRTQLQPTHVRPR